MEWPRTNNQKAARCPPSVEKKSTRYTWNLGFTRKTLYHENANRLPYNIAIHQHWLVHSNLNTDPRLLCQAIVSSFSPTFYTFELYVNNHHRSIVCFAAALQVSLIQSYEDILHSCPCSPPVKNSTRDKRRAHKLCSPD